MHLFKNLFKFYLFPEVSLKFFFPLKPLFPYFKNYYPLFSVIIPSIQKDLSMERIFKVFKIM